MTLRATDETLTTWSSGPSESGRWSENVTSRPDADRWISRVRRTTDHGETWEELFVDDVRRVRS